MHHLPSPSRRRPRPRHRVVVALTLGVLTSLTAAACGGLGAGDSSSESGQDESQASSTPSDGGGGAGGSGADEVTSTGAAVQENAPDPGAAAPAAARANPMQTFDAQIVLGVDRLDDAVAEASSAVEGLGGFAADEDIDLAGSERATVVYRIPAAQFRPALDALAGVGELRRQSIESEDVTSQYSDLESRVTTLRTSIGRLQGFLAETTDVNQIASLEGELTRREAELESIESQRRALADRVALSTVTVDFDAAGSSTRVVEEDRPGFRGGLDAGVETARSLVAIAATAAGFLLPLLPLIASGALALWWMRRRRRAADGTSGTTEE